LDAFSFLAWWQRILEYENGKCRFELGVVGHFGLAVRDPKKSAVWFNARSDYGNSSNSTNGIAVGNDNVTIALFKRKTVTRNSRSPVRFICRTWSILRKALAHLKKHKVDIEDPGHEIGPEAAGSKNMGTLVFTDPDGYRWELSVQGGR